MNKSILIGSVLFAGMAIAVTSAFAATGSGTVASTGSIIKTSVASIGGYKIGGKGGHKMGHFAEMTTAEKTAFDAMTTAEKTAFLEKRHAELEAKHDAQEAVIDKLLNGETLTDADKVIVTAIKAERAARKLQETEMKANMVKLQAIRVKQTAGTTLTTEEQALVDSMPKMKGKHGRGFDMMPGTRSTK